MAKDFGLSCPLCLVANDPADMLGVVIEHAVPVPEALIGLCRRCVLAIVKSAMAGEFIQPAEVFGDATAGGDPAADAAPGPGPDPAAGALVLQNQPDGEEPGVDRREPEMPAGGEERSPGATRNHE